MVIVDHPKELENPFYSDKFKVWVEPVITEYEHGIWCDTHGLPGLVRYRPVFFFNGNALQGDVVVTDLCQDEDDD